MWKDRRKLLWFVGSTVAAWFAGGQLVRAIAGPGYYPPASDSALAHLSGISPLVICVVWAAFLVGGDWRGVLPVAGVLATASQIGSIASDLLTHFSGEPIGHDTWFGDTYYWTWRLTVWLMSFVVFAVLVSLCVLAVRIAQRWRAAV